MDFISNAYKKSSILKLDKPFLCSVESYELQPITKIMRVVDEKKHMVETRLAECNGISRNRCFYGLEDTVNSLKTSKYVTECVSQGIWFGELEHPPRGCDIKRFLRIDDDRICHKIYKFWTEGDFIMGLVQFIPPKGPDVWNWITEANVNMAFSLRIYTPNYIEKRDGAGIPYVVKQFPMTPVTFDAVKNPGYENVRLVDPTKFAQQNQYFLTNGTNTSTGTESYELAWVVGTEDVENTVKDLLESTSQEDLNILSDLTQTDLRKCHARLNTLQHTVTFTDEQNRDMTFALDTFRFNNIMNHK